jgi:hypothetical protein
MEAIDLGASVAPRNFTKETVSKRRNTMSEETKKVDQKVEQTEQEAKAAELSQQDLDNVAGGQSTAVNTSRSNIKNN